MAFRLPNVCRFCDNKLTKKHRETYRCRRCKSCNAGYQEARRDVIKAALPEGPVRVGLKYGMLEVVGPSTRGNYDGCMRPRWNCVCDCGKKVRVFEKAMRQGDKLSCGCLARMVHSRRPHMVHVDFSPTA